MCQLLEFKCHLLCTQQQYRKSCRMKTWPICSISWCSKQPHHQGHTSSWTCKVQSSRFNHSKFKVVWHQFSSLGTSLSGSLFSAVQVTGTKCLHSVQFIPLNSQALPDLTRIDLTDLQSHLVQSPNWFGINSVQFSSLGTSFSGKIMQFSLGHWGQVLLFGLFSLVHSVAFTNSSGPAYHKPQSDRFLYGWMFIHCIFSLKKLSYLTNLKLG